MVHSCRFCALTLIYYPPPEFARVTNSELKWTFKYHHYYILLDLKVCLSHVSQQLSIAPKFSIYCSSSNRHRDHYHDQAVYMIAYFLSCIWPCATSSTSFHIHMDELKGRAERGKAISAVTQ
jgi:hypothetical protein